MNLCHISNKRYFNLYLKVLNVLKWGLNFSEKHYNFSLFCMVLLFRGVLLVLRWCFVIIPGVPLVFWGSFVVLALFRGVKLFRRCSVFCCMLVFGCCAHALCSVVSCSAVQRHIDVKVWYPRHTIKPGTPEHGTPAEHGISSGILTEHRSTGAFLEHWRNYRNITEKRNKRTPA